MTPDVRLLSVGQVAARFGVHRNTVYRLSDPGSSPRLHFIQVGGRRRFDPCDIERYEREQRH